ncbi:MAG TPA: Gfo/Idh/MocA family oxidoreductase [Pseudonocardia sp.]|jgi:predicted dehydrogenase|uniref:Gfo/Idh/MocA family protein n=1 Tax=Pseudonocardia sp. TaxID=60912 RepID=UPI002B4B0DD9|nr:Gfo/Idh/MocA family oxidoreductase [Pseudonocardia sp.]HLU55650.1 Gfo/Idh/MocA family oxidoreductase [Pseudonocardia sp.]
MSDRTERYRVAIVGAGSIAGHRHVPALRAHGDRTELVAVVDVDGDRAAAFAAEHGVAHHHTDVGAMLAEHRPDLVVVCTPPAAHRAGVAACLEAGAWVWCEKPPVLSLAEYDELTALERDGGPYVGYVFQHRFGSAAQALRRQIADGALGRPLVGVCHTLWYRDHAYFEVPWRGKWDTEGGGPTMGHGIHQMDLMLSLLGDWEEVRAMMGTLDRAVETEDVSLAAVRFASGALVSVVNSVLSPREESYLRLDFTDATVEVSHLYGYGNSDWRWTPRAGVADPGWRPTDDVRSSHTAQLAHHLRAMDRRERPPASGADGRRSMELITGLYQSAITGRPVLRSELVPGNPFYDRLDGGGRYAPETAEVAR